MILKGIPGGDIKGDENVDSYIGALRKSNLRNHNTQNNVSLRSLYNPTKDMPSYLRPSTSQRRTSYSVALIN